MLSNDRDLEIPKSVKQISGRLNEVDLFTDERIKMLLGFKSL